jgi:hypothetical protein
MVSVVGPSARAGGVGPTIRLAAAPGLVAARMPRLIQRKARRFGGNHGPALARNLR